MLVAVLISLLCFNSRVHDDWLLKQTLFYTIHYTQADAAAIADIDFVLTSFHKEILSLAGADETLTAASRVEIFLYPPASTEVSLGFVSMVGGPTRMQNENGASFAYIGTVKMPGPAAYDGFLQSSNGHPMDRRYFDKLLIHEVAPVYLELYARSLGSSFHRGMPAWFEQGVEEYLGVFHSTGVLEDDRRGVLLRPAAECRGHRHRLRPQYRRSLQ